MHKKITFDDLEIQKKEYVHNIIEYSKSQVDLWRKIPLLAWEANGRNGWVKTYELAYVENLWAVIDSSNGGYYRVYINILTGEPIDSFQYFYNNKKILPALHKDLLSCDLIHFNASKQIEFLEYQLERPPGQYCVGYDEHIIKGPPDGILR